MRQIIRMMSHGFRAALFTLFLLVVPVHAQGTQRNIVFTNVPDFLKNTWTLVLGPGGNGSIGEIVGSVMTGNALIMLSHKDSAPTVGDFDQQITVESVVQYNLVSKESDTGFNTFFEFRSKNGSAILYPGETFSTLSVRTKPSGPFVSYVIARPSDIADLKKEGLYDRQLETQRRLLAKQYAGLSRGLDH
jgi:uncharacterized protein (UPF0297 family)